jgi:acyl-CoA synthetase (AMP-forming)/AMP-acid ligase II
MTLAVANQGFAAALNDVVSTHGDRPAFRCAECMLTYAELGALVERKTTAYESAGINRLSVVGAIADQPAEFLTDVFALLRLQALVVLLPAEITAWELERLSGAVQLSHILSAAPINASIPVGPVRFLTAVHDARISLTQGPGLGFLTSGTTGRPKVALRTEQAMLVEAAAMRHELDLTPGRRIASIVPVHHSFGFGDCALSGILAGAEVYSYPRMHPSAYLAAFKDSAIDVVALVPPQLRLLAQACNAPVFASLSVFSAGAPLDARTDRLARQRLGCMVGQVYGTTETGVIAVAPPSEGSAASVGKPAHHVEVRLEKLPSGWEATAEVPDEGVVTVRSLALFEGYMTLDGIDRRAVDTGWFSTGDRARFVEGRLQLLGRISCAINVAGAKVSPEEVEAALLDFPAVRSALVLGVEDVLSHQRIKACVTPADVDLKALRRFCEERLSPTKRPHYYEAVAALATTPSGKVVRTDMTQEGSVCRP